MQTNLRHSTILVFLFSLTLLAFGSVPKSVNGQEAPSVRAGANAPGWITVYWEHTGQDVYYFVIERQDAPYTENSVFLIGQSNNRTDSLTDKNLKADTLYKYHVCAVYASSRTCSDWVSVRTLSSGGSSGSAPPPPAHPPLATPEITATRDQDPKHILVDWSGDPGWYPYRPNGSDAYPGEYKHLQLKQVVLYQGIPGTSKYTIPAYDSLKYPGADLYPGVISYLSRTFTVRANTVYTFKVCFTSISDETKCSREITASGKPVAPTAPADVTVSQDKSLGRTGDLAARIRTFITARWRNTDIPGQFITLEREDRVQLDRLRVGPAWVEIKQISADPHPTDPTEVTVDTTPEGPELMTQRGNNYRVCAVLPVLGAAGKVCSSAVSPGAITASTKVVPLPDDSKRARNDNAYVLKGAFDVNALAARGEALANADPLAAELRNREPEGPIRRGFYIGMAAAEGQTLPGPGKQKIHDSLSAAEQGGFDTAVSFSLERNRNADFAAKGAAIAEQDPIVAEARNLETDVFYRLGFDIASGIFGDPALGAKGNTETGPGSLKIRDSLSAAGQRGFNASVVLHLSRSYKH
jgi:hypothetical protein